MSFQGLMAPKCDFYFLRAKNNHLQALSVFLYDLFYLLTLIQATFYNYQSHRSLCLMMIKLLVFGLSFMLIINLLVCFLVKVQLFVMYFLCSSYCKTMNLGAFVFISKFLCFFVVKNHFKVQFPKDFVCIFLVVFSMFNSQLRGLLTFYHQIGKIVELLVLQFIFLNLNFLSLML